MRLAAGRLGARVRPDGLGRPAKPAGWSRATGWWEAMGWSRTTGCLMAAVLLGGVGLAGILPGIAEAQEYAYWNQIRHSATLPCDLVEIRMENPAGGAVENHLLYLTTAVEEVPMALIPDGPSSLAAAAPAPVTGPRGYGFRLTQGEEIDILPVRLGDGVTPEPGQLTRLATDPAGDEIFGYANLDLVDCRVSFSGDQIHASLSNTGGGFPVSQGFTFFGYLLGIADPALADPDTVFAMMYTLEQSGIISPGLYKITGTGLGDLEQLGDVTIQEHPETNSLRISCQLADLTSDPYFQSWFDPLDGALGVAGFTQRITVFGGAQEADRTPGGRMYLREVTIEPGVNTLPVLADPIFEGEGTPEALARIDYDDPDGHCPVLAEIVFDGADAYPLYPETLDYSGTVIYATDAGIEALVQGGWTEAVFRFSDNGVDVVEYPVSPTAVEEDPAMSGLRRLVLSILPNPRTQASVGATVIELDLPAAQPVRAAVYDPSGALVRLLADDRLPAGRSALRWDGRDAAGRLAGAGVYFVKVTTRHHAEAGRIVVLN